MWQKIIHFLKYNNLAVFLVLAVFLASGGVFAATPTGRDAIGLKQSRIEGVDNSLLIAADLDNFNMDMQIKKIDQDESYYYVTYTYLDLSIVESAWQYQLNEKVMKITRKLKEDLGVYLSKELKEQYDARLKDLRQEKEKALAAGQETRVEVTEYSGLIGKTLDLAATVFPNYEPVKKAEMPSPPALTLPSPTPGVAGEGSTGADNLTKIYNDYVLSHDYDKDGVLDMADNCTDIANADQLDSDGDGWGDVCDDLTQPSPAPDVAGEGEASSTPSGVDAPIEGEPGTAPDGSANNGAAEPESVEIIDLPAVSTEPAASDNTPGQEPVVTPDTAPVGQ